MILAIFRNFRSRLARTTLTVAGIAIGILALVVVGSLAERLQTIVGRSAALNSGAIFAFGTGRELFGPDSRDRMRANIDRVRKLPGVAAIVPEVIIPYATGFAESTRFGPPSLVFGFPYTMRAAANGTLAIATGRDYAARERRVAIVGPDFATAAHVHVGDIIALYGNSFEVVGIIAKSFTLFDAAIVVPLPDAQALVGQLVPPSAPAGSTPPATALMIQVAPHADTALLARRISLFTGLQARDPAEVAGNIRSTTQIFDAIIFGSALIALVVGAFSIVNTMTIAVSERTPRNRHPKSDRCGRRRYLARVRDGSRGHRCGRWCGRARRRSRHRRLRRRAQCGCGKSRTLRDHAAPRDRCVRLCDSPEYGCGIVARDPRGTSRSDRCVTAGRMISRAQTPLIDVRDLVKVHATGTAAQTRALDGITFAIEAGSYVAIVGESGSGKTTLMHVLGALDRATSGSVVLAGRDLATASRAELKAIRANEIGFVFQGFNLIPTLTATENVELAARYARCDATTARAEARRLLDDVDLGNRAHHRPAQLSGGQQQRVAIARALVNAPSLLLADEPTGELDTRTAESVLQLLERYNRERGQTIVLVTHNPAVWERCQTVISLSDGRIVDIAHRAKAGAA